MAEGVLDAPALDAAGTSAGLDIAAVSPSGVVLTAAHGAEVVARSAGAPVLCADGDTAGRVATAKWAAELTLIGREVVATTLPGPHDPADWLAEKGPDWLAAFVRTGRLEACPGELRPVHAGQLLAELMVADGQGPTVRG